ncbi:hypothetical protein ACLOJK_009514 [Asimina triloba]
MVAAITARQTSPHCFPQLQSTPRKETTRSYRFSTLQSIASNDDAIHVTDFD